MAKHVKDLFEDKARAGEGQYAIAYALMEIADQQKQIARVLGQLAFDGPGGNPGALEFVGMELRDIRKALDPLVVDAGVEVRSV